MLIEKRRIAWAEPPSLVGLQTLLLSKTGKKIEEENYRTNTDIHDVVSAPRLLERVSGVKYLGLSASTLPCFYNLKHLKVRLFLCSYWDYVMELLKRSPNLEDIVLDICPWTWIDKQ